MWYKNVIETISELHYPPTDVYETKNELVIVCEVPGMSMKDLNINVSENVLTISGVKTASDLVDNSLKDITQVYYHLSERLQKTFKRSFFLKENLDQNNVNATFKDGLLTVIVLKKVPNEIKTINIKEENQ